MTADRAPLAPTFPDLRSLDLFVSVVSAGSLTAAGARHRLSQPSVSNRIRGLERQLGVTLLERGPAGSVPTRHGSLVAGWAEAVLRAADDFAVAAESLRRQPTRPVVIAASYTIAEHLLPRWLHIWHDRGGRRAELEVVNSTVVVERVERGVIDVGFVETTAGRPTVRTAMVGRDQLVCIVAADHPWARSRRARTPASLASSPWVSREVGSGTRESFVAALRAVGVAAPEPVMELGSTAAVVSAVVDGIGYAVLSRLAVGADLERGRLSEVATVGLDLIRPLRAVWRTGSTLSPEASALVDVARDHPPGEPG